MHWCEGGLGDFGGFGWFLVVFGDFGRFWAILVIFV